MNNPTSLKNLEREVFRTITKDGILDIQIGSVLLIFAIAPLLSNTLGDFWSSAIFLPFWGLIFLALRIIRKSQLKPRIGQVEFGPYRVKRLKNLNLIFLVFNLAAFAIGLLAFFNVVNMPGALPVSILLLIGFSLGGYMLESPRFYLYGIFSAIAPLIGEYLYNNHGFSHHGFPVVFGILASGMILYGVFRVITLIRDYPLPAGEAVE